MAGEMTRKEGTSLRNRPRGATPLSWLQREMNRLFSDFWIEPFSGLAEWAPSFTPMVDVSEDDKEVRVSAELPGMDEKDIDVTVTDSMLTIRGEKKQEEEEKDKGFYRRESSYGTFQRMIDLPAGVDENKAQAEFKKGILRITLPKTVEAQSKSRKVKIKSG